MARERLSFRDGPRVGDVLTFLPPRSERYTRGDVVMFFVVGALIGGTLSALGVMRMVERIQMYASF